MSDMMMDDATTSPSRNHHAAAHLNNHASSPQLADEEDLLALLSGDTFSLESRRDKDLVLLSSILKGVIPMDPTSINTGTSQSKPGMNQIQQDHFYQNQRQQLSPSQNSFNTGSKASLDDQQCLWNSSSSLARNGNGLTNTVHNYASGMMATRTPHGTPMAVDNQTLQPPPPSSKSFASTSHSTLHSQNRSDLTSPNYSKGLAMGMSSQSDVQSCNEFRKSTPPPNPLSPTLRSSSPHPPQLFREDFTSFSPHVRSPSATHYATSPGSSTASSGIRAPAASRERGVHLVSGSSNKPESVSYGHGDETSMMTTWTPS